MQCLWVILIYKTSLHNVSDCFIFELYSFLFNNLKWQKEYSRRNVIYLYTKIDTKRVELCAKWTGIRRRQKDWTSKNYGSVQVFFSLFRTGNLILFNCRQRMLLFSETFHQFAPNLFIYGRDICGGGWGNSRSRVIIDFWCEHWYLW